MANLFQLQERFQKLDRPKNLEKILFQTIRKNEKTLLSLNKQQLGEGRDVHGNITGTYSRATEIEYRFGEGPRPRKPKIEGQPYNYEDQGDFLDGFFLDISNGQAEWNSKDSKTPLLVQKYGDLFGLDDENLKLSIKNIIVPALLTHIRSTLKI
ncbi:hypothetical protein [Flagellimonas flava]|uniref:hypothetical protein n=1 Tax=Flagellimonas flava TaxID=570519 RepID=UPI003D64A87B